MSRIPMPPTQVEARVERKFSACTEYGKDFYIDFNDAGVLGRLEDGVFNPDVPPGHYVAGQSIGPFRPVKNNTSLDLVFVDDTDGKGYLDTVEIQSTCP